MRKILVLIILILPMLVFGQRRNRYKWEWIGGMGMTNLLGDLGGSPFVGSHGISGARDLNWGATRPSFTGGLRYKNSRYFGFKAALSCIWLYGNDALSSNPIRHNRNLNVRTNVIELSSQVEFYPFKDQQGKLYRLRNARGRGHKLKALQPYLFLGISGFYFNPMGYQASTGWVNLRPLHTEGEGLPGGPPEYSQFSISIPFGIGVKYALDRQWSVGFELGLHYTFTDYLDDVSGNYYSPALFLKYEGPVLGAQSIQFADPSLDKDAGGNSTAGQERGNPQNKDAFILGVFNLNYKIMTKTRRRSKF